MTKQNKELTDETLDEVTGGTERVTLNYEEIKWTYNTRSSSKGNAETTWKVEEGVK